MKTPDNPLPKYVHCLSTTQLMNPEGIDDGPASLVVEMLQRAQLPTQWGNKTILTLSSGSQTIEVAANGNLTSPTGEISKDDAEEVLAEASGAIFYQLAKAGKLTNEALKNGRLNEVSTIAVTPEGFPLLYLISNESVNRVIKLTLKDSQLPEDSEMQQALLSDWQEEIDDLLTLPNTLGPSSNILNITIQQATPTAKRQKAALEASLQDPTLLGNRQTIRFNPYVEKNYAPYSPEEKLIIDLTETAPEEALRHLDLFDPRLSGKIDMTTRRGAQILNDLFFAIDNGKINWDDFSPKETETIANQIQNLMPVVFSLLKEAIKDTGRTRKHTAAIQFDSAPEAIRAMLQTAIEGYGKLEKTEEITNLVQRAATFFSEAIPLAHDVDKQHNQSQNHQKRKLPLTIEEIRKSNRAENIVTNLAYRFLSLLPVIAKIDNAAEMPMLLDSKLFMMFLYMLDDRFLHERNPYSIQDSEMRKFLQVIFNEQERSIRRL